MSPFRLLLPGGIPHRPQRELTYQQHVRRWWGCIIVFIISLVAVAMLVLYSLVFADHNSILPIALFFLALFAIMAVSFPRARHHDDIIMEMERMG